MDRIGHRAYVIGRLMTWPGPGRFSSDSYVNMSISLSLFDKKALFLRQESLILPKNTRPTNFQNESLIGIDRFSLSIMGVEITALFQFGESKLEYNANGKLLPREKGWSV